MAERERLPNKERRDRAREERKRKEEEQAKQRTRGRLRTWLLTAAVTGVVAAVALSAFLGGPTSIDDAIMVNSEDAAAAREDAGCELLAEREPLPDRSHFPADQPPPAETLYGDFRPPHSGSHADRVHPIVSGGADSQLDERALTHNLEHSSIVVWHDPQKVDRDTAGQIGDWAATLNASGFNVPRAGVAIFSAPYEDPGISSGKAVAFRAWGTAMDCDQWDETVANAFVIENYGTHGIAPERTMAPYPEQVLIFQDRDVEDSDTPEDGQMPQDPDAASDGDADTAESSDSEQSTAAALHREPERRSR